MFPKYPLSLANNQSGFLVPLAAIIIVGIGVLAISISRLSSQGNTSAIFEGLSLQALYAAETGANAGLHNLFFDNSDRNEADSRCNTLNTTPLSLNYSATGLSACSATVTCSFTTNGTVSYYTLESRGSCGTSLTTNTTAERTIEVSAWM